MSKKNAIYILICSMTGEIRYVGKAKCVKNRLAWHLQPKNRKAKNHKNNWLNKVLELGFKPEIHVVENLPPEHLSEAEIFWIAYYQSIGCRLTNGTKGGEGALGRVSSPESLAKMSASAKARGLGGLLPGHNKRVSEIINGEECISCSKCKTKKSTTMFSFLENRKYYDAYCKPCRAEVGSEYKAANPPTLLTPEEHAVIRQENHKKSSETLKLTYQNRPELKAQLSKQRSKAIQGVNVVTKEVITFSSALEAKSAGFQNSNIGQAIKLNKAYRGYTWSFIQETL